MTKTRQIKIATRSIFALPDEYRPKPKARNYHIRNVYEIEGVKGQFKGLEELHDWFWRNGSVLARHSIGSAVNNGRLVDGRVVRVAGQYDVRNDVKAKEMQS